MYKSYFIIFFFLCNCSHPSTALFGPVITGATTKSIGQVSVSYGTNQIINQIRETSKNTKKEVKKIITKVDDLNSQVKSKEFFVSVKNLYLTNQSKKKDF